MAFMTATASLKALARDACGQVLSLSGITAPAARLRERLSIITFHRVLTESQRKLYPLPGLAVTPDELDAHLTFATRHFRCLPLASALDLWAQGAVAGRPILAVTFDDGQVDNFQNALPVLEKHRIAASFYVPSQILEDTSPLWHDALATCIGRLNALPPSQEGDELLAQLHEAPGREPTLRPTHVETALESTKAWSAAKRRQWIERAQNLLSHADRHPWDGFMNVKQMKALLAGGHEIGSHSHSHPLLPDCTDAELEDEIVGSRQRLESALGTAVTTFCYPNGSLDARSLAKVRQAGYRAAVTTRWGSNPPGEDPLQLQRFDMNATHAKDRNGAFSGARLAWRISGLYPGLTGSRSDPYSGAMA
jgi:peptidoglycan/xylan/chitin deacetylase (PgdA/CDA1 family)